MPTILVIDDNLAVSTALEVLFSLHDINTLHTESPEVGLTLLRQEQVDLVIQDMNFSADTTSGAEGEALFAAIRAQHPDLPVILLTAWTHLEAAVNLVKAGAIDYIAKPWDDRKLLTTVNNLIELSEARRELDRRRQRERRSREQLTSRYDLRGLVFEDPASERMIALACQVARSDLPVLITGPNGSGKEKIAEIIQANSSVQRGPFVTLNCGALPAELIEAELFGADAGAYTGANKAREGKFEAADGGTLFLDEIGNLPLAGQMKLLRVLETGRFERLGSNRERQVKVRVISATNADLPGMIRDGGFREDLYYRLNAIELTLPPLADRPGDILPLAEHFRPDDKPLADSARSALVRHAWPGNVRELRNVMQRAGLLAQGARIEAGDLNLPRAAPPRSNGHDEPDRAAVESALARAGGVIAQAAAELGLSRQALYRRMDRYGIPRE
ncbi:sigma-54-dependent transcriptional regulator [Pseudoxanthomonas indica]|uniref:DNA-binding transcriptional response regulator, NtrC family, contains REC, AAA-type ATPase, and a Fis-type DNA-binding domains n=1 Tax=Pseudoxanthomonas indica TaxID=428993 RepID=A0A1T5K4U0_9GAMM|nr:sigma-54 dependent transcriptional regulator [Pseudoxanthomonas indica]GGD46783.1 sigma-54-dependent Fis family transcriptional regulator [Pseudoxanthomonas indica]SKC58762.1 DNA-binding transcriptional response regulator, NtrC family, contains REC, AAA-type ATPase, and a Fis-type DNA-binding domains [Pseudoxanthomonas indica]